MSAVDTARRTLARSLQGRIDEAIRGDLRGLSEISRRSWSEPLFALARTGAARLRLSDPPLGDPEPPSSDSVVLVAALGGAHEHPAMAAHLIAGIAPPRGTWEHVLRHALVVPFLPHLTPEIADAARGASPWTALLERPPRHRERAAWSAGEGLRRHPDGRRLLCATLAEPSRGEVLRWRTRLLDRLRLQEENFVLDVYESAWVHHGEAHLDAIHRARRALGDSGASEAHPSDAHLEEALAIADWWGPLWALDRSRGELLRARRHLGYEYREGLRLHGTARALRAF